MNPSTHSASLKKIHLFLQSLVEGHFYFIKFSVFVSFCRLFFSNSSCCEWRPCAIKFGASSTCHVYPHTLCFTLIMCLCVVVELACLGVVVNEFICDQWGRKGMHIGIYFLFNIIWDRRQMPFILLCRFLCDFFELYIHTYVHLQLNTSVHPFQSSNLQQGRHCLHLNHCVSRCWVWCVPSWVEVCLVLWLQEETLQTKTSQKLF